MMEPASPTVVLGSEISARLAEFTHKRKRDRRKAFGLKLGAAVLGAAVTVLLGLKVSASVEPLLKNIALIAGALVAVLNAWDAFYDHRALWVKRTTTAARLKSLERKVRIARARTPELTPEQLDAFRITLDEILDDDLSSWVQMRSERLDEPAKPAGGSK